VARKPYSSRRVELSFAIQCFRVFRYLPDWFHKLIATAGYGYDVPIVAT
jgi:hypothetical protein